MANIIPRVVNGVDPFAVGTLVRYTDCPDVRYAIVSHPTKKPSSKHPGEIHITLLDDGHSGFVSVNYVDYLPVTSYLEISNNRILGD
jgi:hypothetical protein